MVDKIFGDYNDWKIDMFNILERQCANAITLIKANSFITTMLLPSLKEDVFLASPPTMLLSRDHQITQALDLTPDHGEELSAVLERPNI